MSEQNQFNRTKRFKQLLDKKLEASRPGAEKGTLEEAFQELLSLSEELEVADEELRDQNEQLLSLQVELEMERQRFLDLFQFAPSGYLVTNSQGIIQEANLAASEILVIEPTLIIGKPLILFVEQEDRQEYLDRLARLNGSIQPRQVQFHNWEIRMGRKKDGYVYVSIDAAYVSETQQEDEKKSQPTIRWILRDISRQKMLEAELAEARRRLVFGLEQERQQIAREIHDVPIQDLMGALIMISAIAKLDDRQQLLAKLEETRQIVTKSVRSLRSIIGQLRPPAITPFGLEKAIRSHALDLERTYPDIQFHLELTQDKLSLPEEVRLSLFRIYQNSIQNVVHHSKAQNVIVRFDIKDGMAFLQVEDDGVGFEVPERLTTFVYEDHLGLANAAERAEVLGGEFQVKSTPGKGTIVRANVPTAV